MSVAAVDLALSAASLTNGARLVAAGGAYPQRIMPEAEYFFDVAVAVKGVIFGADDVTIICSMNGTTRKFDFTGFQLWSVTQALCLSIDRIDADHLVMGRNAATASFHTLVESTQVIGTTPIPLGSQSIVRKVPGQDLIWLSARGTTLTEVVASTGAATGRTITVAAHNNMWTADGDGVAGVYTSGGSSIFKYRQDTLVLEKTWLMNGIGSSPGGSGINEFIVDSIGRPIIVSGVSAIDRLNAAAGNQKDVTERLIWAGPEIAGGAQPVSGGGNQAQPPMAISSNGRYFAFTTNKEDQTAAGRGMRVRNLLTQRVQWNVPVSGGTWKGLEMPGQLGNTIGDSTGWRTGTVQDFRRAKIWYQRVGVDGAPVVPQDFVVPVGGISLTGASALLVGVDFDCGFGKPSGPLPYVGGASGEGPRVWIDDGIAASGGHRNRLYGSM